MTARRPRSARRAVDDRIPYPVLDTPGFPLETNPELDAALQALSDALAACAEPLTAAVSQLTTGDVGQGLTATPLDKRDLVLHPLGLLLRPRKITTALCQDVVNRLSRPQNHDRRYAVAAMTVTVWQDVQRAASVGLSPQAEESDVRKTLSRWGTALVRVSMWAHGVASVRDAQIWLWAGEQPWFRPEGVTDEQIEAVVVAARRVVDHSCDYDEAQGDEEQMTNRETVDVMNATDSMPANEADRDHSDVDGNPLAQLLALRDNLDRLLEDTIPAANRVVNALCSRCVPTTDDLAALDEARAAFERFAEAMASAGVVLKADSMAAADAALDLLGADAGDRETRKLLLEISNLVVSDDNPGLVASLQKAQVHAQELLDRHPWEPEIRVNALALVALHGLTDPDLEPATHLALVQQVTTAYPDLALLAVQAQNLTVQPPPVISHQGSDVVVIGPVPEVAQHQATEPRQFPELAAVPSGERTSNESNEPDREFTDPIEALPASVEPDPVISEEVRARTEIVDRVAEMIAESRFGMADAVAASAGGWPAAQRAVWRIAALATVVRSENGACAAALRSEFDALDTGAVSEDTAAVLVAIPALIRIALITGEPTAGALLTEFASCVEHNLAEIAEQVGRRALRGVLAGTAALAVLADVTDVEQTLARTGEAAAAVLRPRTLRFKRATDIAQRWLTADGLLGKPLTIAATNDRSAVNEVLKAVAQLSDSGYVKIEIDALDRKLRGHSSRPLEGSGLHDLQQLAQAALKPLSDWAQAVITLGRTAHSDDWSTGEVADMRAAVLERRKAALDALQKRYTHKDPVLAAAARAGTALLLSTFETLEGGMRLSESEPAPALALTIELLKVPGAIVDETLGHVVEPEGTNVLTLLTAARRTWTDAVLEQIAAENFDTAHYLLSSATDKLLLAAGGSSVELVNCTATLTAAESDSREELARTHARLITELRRARSNSEVSDDQDGELTSLLEDAGKQLPGWDLGGVRASLETVARRLPGYRTEAARRLRERLARVATADRGIVSRVTRLIDDGQLSTAEELIYFLEIGEPPPEVEPRGDLSRFFTAAPDALPDGVTDELVRTVRTRSRYPDSPVLDFSQVNEPDVVAEALSGWRRITHSLERGTISEREHLLPALRLAGIEGKRIHKLPEFPRGRDRRFIDIGDVNIVGKALVPAFGTKLNHRLRVLLAWGQPSAELLMSHADQDPARGSLLIAHFGTMSVKTRLDLAARAVERKAPIVVLDDAALAYLAAHGNRQMDATMSVLLPFSSVNPYLRHKRGLVAEEMFYGRNAELESLLDPDGTQLVFGGRGLGKSALLRSAGTRFESQGGAGERISIYLSLDTLGITANSPIGADLIWGHLLRELTERGVVPAVRVAKRSAPDERVRAGVLHWMRENPQRRMLILLDESDRYFEADAPTFVQTTRLKELGQASDSAVKVVFAGLHSVQRWAKSARNGPFSHLAQRPTVIGPLRPQFASDLLTRPLDALGFVFADVDLVNRVLGYCSYQPFLLQMFANRLVETMHLQRGAAVLPGAMPYVITQKDVEAVEQHVDLKADIRDAFHDTLHLDPRYNVIANVLAHHAHESGLDARLTDVQLRDECLAWWPAGFARLDVEGFRAYLSEMVGLGVVAPNNDGRGWHLRSPNVLRMIGSQDDVETQLVGASILSVPEEFVALETRLALPDGRRSPLTASQVDDLLGDRVNQVRVVLGSVATGIDAVVDAVRAATDTAGQFNVPVVSRRQQFEEQLVDGKPGERRVVMTDLFALTPREDACHDALAAAVDCWPDRAGVTRSAVIIAGPEQLPLWREALERASRTACLSTVALRRYDRPSLQVWAMNSEKFSRDERFTQLLKVTGGWPLLVEKVAALARGGLSEIAALRQIEDEIASEAGAAVLVDAVGITGSQDLTRAFEAVVSLFDVSGMPLTDVVEAAGMAVEDPALVVECLVALQVFDVADNGDYSVEPILARCWPHRS